VARLVLRRSHRVSVAQIEVSRRPLGKRTSARGSHQAQDARRQIKAPLIPWSLPRSFSALFAPQHGRRVHTRSPSHCDAFVVSLMGAMSPRDVIAFCVPLTTYQNVWKNARARQDVARGARLNGSKDGTLIWASARAPQHLSDGTRLA
jgi:hypothetical protein